MTCDGTRLRSAGDQWVAWCQRFTRNRFTTGWILTYSMYNVTPVLLTPPRDASAHTLGDLDVQTELSMSLSYSYKVSALPLARPGMSPSALVNVPVPTPGVADCSIIAGKEIKKFPARRVHRPNPCGPRTSHQGSSVSISNS